MSRGRTIRTLIVLAGLLAYRYYTSIRTPAGAPSNGPIVVREEEDVIATAFHAHARDRAVTSRGIVTRLLSDDREGDRHQRFLLRTFGGTTVLIAHNLELAPRVDPLAEGDTVAFRGEYVWNAKGGVVHWTHDDPDGRHAPGWIEAGGRRFQ